MSAVATTSSLEEKIRAKKPGGRMRRHDLPLASVPLDRGLEESDAILIATDHDAVDHSNIAQRAKLLVDARGALRERGVGADPERTALA